MANFEGQKFSGANFVQPRILHQPDAPEAHVKFVEKYTFIRDFEFATTYFTPFQFLRNLTSVEGWKAIDFPCFEWFIIRDDCFGSQIYDISYRNCIHGFIQ